MCQYQLPVFFLLKLQHPPPNLVSIPIRKFTKKIKNCIPPPGPGFGILV